VSHIAISQYAVCVRGGNDERTVGHLAHWSDPLRERPLGAIHRRPFVAAEEAPIDVPLGIRLDFDAGSVWSVVGIPQPPTMHEVFVPGDEILIIFAADRVRQIGFPDDFAR
jgi:hypothetical protein